MAPDGTVIIGAGPAGIRAAQVLAAAGFRPTVIDEATQSGGQICRRPSAGAERSAEELYGFEARRARDMHAAFDEIKDRIDYRPDTLVWAVAPGVLHTISQGGWQT